MKIIRFHITSGPETCLTDGQIGCDVQAPCCDGLSCIMILMDPSIVMDIIVKDLVTQCVKNYSGKSHCPLLRFSQNFNFNLFLIGIIKLLYLSLSSVHKSLSGMAKQQRCNEGEYPCCTLGGCYCAPPGACYL